MTSVPNTSIAADPVSGTSRWSIDPAHSVVEFGVRHMMISTVKGRFTSVKGSILDVAGSPSLSSVEVEIETASVNTGDEKRDAHLRSPDFFDAATYPLTTFKSTHIEGTRDDFKVTGDLTIRDQTRPVTVKATFNGEGRNPYGKTVASFSGSTKLNRKDFGLNWNVALETGGVLVGDELKVEIEIQAVKQDAS